MISSTQKLQFAIAAPLIFLVLSTTAMFFYTGGNSYSASESTYNFSLNFFSDLGRIHGFNGNTSLISTVCFVVGLLGVSLATYFFFTEKMKLFKTESENMWMKQLVQKLALPCAIGYVVIGFTPWDYFPNAHAFAVRGTFLLFAFICFLVGFLVIKHKTYPTYYAYVYFFFMCLLILFIILPFIGFRPKESVFNLKLNVIIQKVVVYTQVLVVWFQAYGMQRYLKLKL